jgi:tubulin polyglutamylase TTLL9
VQQVIMQDKHSFELYGFDILLDTDLKPWLIEVNASPALSGDTDSDYALKFALMKDTLDVIDVEGNGTSEGTDNVGGYDLIWDNGPVRTEQRTCYSTFLGGHNAHEDTPLETKRTRAAEGAAAQAAAQAAQQAAAAQAAQ